MCVGSYYINRVKDVYRQATVDLLLGNSSSSELTLLRNAVDAAAAAAADEDESSQQVLVEKEENLKTLIDECKRMLITEPEHCLGGWGLIDCDPRTGDPAQQDMDIILLLSQNAYYVARSDTCLLPQLMRMRDEFTLEVRIGINNALHFSRDF